MFSYIRRLGAFLGVQNFEFQLFLCFQKNEYFWGYEDFVDIFWGHHKIGLYLGGHFRVSSLGQGTEYGIIFWVAKFNFLGVLEIPDIFGGEW